MVVSFEINHQDYQAVTFIQKKKGDEGVVVAEICRKVGNSQVTNFNLKKKYTSMLPLETRQLKQIEDENAWVKKIIAAWLQTTRTRYVVSATSTPSFNGVI